MPHVNIKHFPKDFTDEQKERLAEAITAVVTEHFATDEGNVSVALEPVAAAEWNQAVGTPELLGRADLLIRRPAYQIG